MNDTTAKLFRVPVACFSEFDFSVGTWMYPYYVTELGLGFAGYYLEAMSIATLYRQVVERLVTIEPGGAARPKPEPQKLVNLLLEITRKYFAQHSSDLPVEFLLFGYAPEEEPRAWVAQIEKKTGREPVLKYVAYDLTFDDQIWSIGDAGAGTKFKSEVADLRRRIRKHQEALKTGASPEPDLDRARHRVGVLRGTEIKIKEELENRFKVTVGGVMQKMEVYPRDNGSAVAVISRDDRLHILDGLPPLAADLLYLPISETMGNQRKARG